MTVGMSLPCGVVTPAAIGEGSEAGSAFRDRCQHVQEITGAASEPVRSGSRDTPNNRRVTRRGWRSELIAQAFRSDR
jgi:hypothetical protein